MAASAVSPSQRLFSSISAGFTDATQVRIDSTPLDPARYLRGGNGWLNLDMPQLALGPHLFTVSENGASETLPFAVVSPAEPRYEADEGTPDDLLFSSLGVDTLHADQPGHVHTTYLSLSGLPSIHPLLTLALGNQFTDVHRCTVQTIPAAGWLSVHHAVPPGMATVGTVIYSQSVCTSHGLPLHASNRQESVYQF